MRTKCLWSHLPALPLRQPASVFVCHYSQTTAELYHWSSIFSNFVIAAINFILVKEGRLEGSAWVIQQHSRVFGVPVTTPQFVQTCLQLSPVQRNKQELIAVTNSFFFPLLPSGSFSCEVSCNKHVTREAVMTQSGPINYSGVIFGHTLRNS